MDADDLAGDRPAAGCDLQSEICRVKSALNLKPAGIAKERLPSEDIK